MDCALVDGFYQTLWVVLLSLGGPFKEHFCGYTSIRAAFRYVWAPFFGI